MTLILRTPSLGLLRCGALMIFGLALAGCDREQIKVQQVPKESEMTAQPPETATPPAMPPMDPHAGMNLGGGTHPQIKWTLPNGWQEKPLSQMRAGSFNVQGRDGQTADVSIIPLPSGGPEMELANLNMWRGELQLLPAEKAESQPVTIGPGQGKLFEIAEGQKPGRILVAVLDRDGTSWYFKMKGEDAFVHDEKPMFLQFLKAVSFESAPEVVMSDPHAGMPMDSTPVAASPNSSGVPAGWTQVTAGDFLVAKYAIQGSGDAKAEVNIGMLAGQGGGAMANITRWRGQLGLPPLSEEDWSKQVRSLDLPGGKATLVDMTGTDMKSGKKSRLLGVIAPQANETWFYKLMGDEQIVEQQKDAFTKFIQTAKFSNAP